jgi:hypothetical protein
MSKERKSGPRLPPRWFIRLAWAVHRGLYGVTGSRVGLWRPKANRWGTLRLTTIGRRTGRERGVILGYFEDGPTLVTLAMNGWAEASRRGGSTCRRTLTLRPMSSTGRARCGDAPQRAMSGRACGPGGVRSTQTWTPTPLSGRPRPRW